MHRSIVSGAERMRALRTLIACAATAAVLVAGVTRVLSQNGSFIATPEQPATLTIARPPANDIFLDLWLKAYTPPRQGSVEAVVSLGPQDGEPMEIGRFTFFPGGPFAAAGARDERAFRFNASKALNLIKAGDAALAVRVALIPNDEKISPQGAKIIVSRAKFSPRP